MRKNKIFVGVMTAAMIMGSLTLPETISMDGIGAISVQAAEVVDSGTCGDNLTWVLDDEGTLTISGTGEMERESIIPWSDYRNYIISVVIENGVTSICDYAFSMCANLTSVEFPDTLKSIGELAFWTNGSGQGPSNVELNDGLESIGYGAFAQCTNITEIVIPPSVSYIGAYAFGYGIGTDIGGHYVGGVLASSVTIYGYEGTAAERYVEEYGSYSQIWSDGSNETLEEGVAATFISLGAYDAADVTTLGDANLDDNIDYLDAMAVLRADAELIELTDAQLIAADVNGDGCVDSLDAIMILRYDAGLIDSFE